jgi:hypothetical protein
MTFTIDDKMTWVFKISYENVTRIKANSSLAGTIKNHLKEWLRNQKQLKFFLGLFSLNVFITINYYYFMFINCML